MIPVTQGIAITLASAVVAIALLALLQPAGAQQRPRFRTATAATTRSAPRRSSAIKVGRGRPAEKMHEAHRNPASRRGTRVTVAPPHVGVGQTEVTFTDPTRDMVVEGRRMLRSFRTIIRYPVGLRGPFPLIVFGHGYDVTPAPYAELLDAWTRAGYVVAAPIFPFENANAPGGPNERDLVNQPGDMSLVIASLQSPDTPAVARVADLTNLARIAVAGQSDGGDTALAAAYGPSRDTRISAAIILSGAEDPFAPAFPMPSSGPPLLAVQGTADTINPPEDTYQFYNEAAPPKYLLKLLGAGHQPPYTEPGADLTTVERVTIAFLDDYLQQRPAALSRYASGQSPGPDSALSSEQ